MLVGDGGSQVILACQAAASTGNLIIVMKNLNIIVLIKTDL